MLADKIKPRQIVPESSPTECDSDSTLNSRLFQRPSISTQPTFAHRACPHASIEVYTSRYSISETASSVYPHSPSRLSGRSLVVHPSWFPPRQHRRRTPASSTRRSTRPLTTSTRPCWMLFSLGGSSSPPHSRSTAVSGLSGLVEATVSGGSGCSGVSGVAGVV